MSVSRNMLYILFWFSGMLVPRGPVCKRLMDYFMLAARLNSTWSHNNFQETQWNLNTFIRAVILHRTTGSHRWDTDSFSLGWTSLDAVWSHSNGAPVTGGQPATRPVENHCSWVKDRLRVSMTSFIRVKALCYFWYHFVNYWIVLRKGGLAWG